MKSPFKFLDAYTLEDRDVFFGRDKEMEQLYDAVNKNRLVLVYGQSGTGKTSLVQCGLASRFDATDWYPIFIRRQEDINQAFQQALEKAAKRPLAGSLADNLQRLNARFLRPIYLIFDQLEELLILGSPEERGAFIQSLQQILQAEELSCHLILILREEYIANLYPFEQAIPTFFDRRLRVEPMSLATVGQVIRKSCTRFNITLEAPDRNVKQIIDNVSVGKSGIQLPYLQVYLDMLWREDYERTYSKSEVGNAKSEMGEGELADGGRQTADRAGAETPKYQNTETPPLTFTTAEIAQFGQIDDVLYQFLLEQEELIGLDLRKSYPALPEQAVRQVLDVFVTPEGTKLPVHFQREEGSGLIILEESVQKLLLSGVFLSPSAEASQERRIEQSPPESTKTRKHKNTNSPLTAILESLEQSRILRFSDETIELAHDSLARLIDEQRSEEQRQLNEAKNRIASAYREWERTEQQLYLSRRQLLSLEEWLPKMQLGPHLEQFVADCYAYNEAQEKAERQRQQAELELAQAKLAAEERARKRQRLFLILVSFALLLAVWQWWDAKKSKKQAEDNLVVANEAEEAAKKAKDDALANLDLANQREAEAVEARQDALANLNLANQREKELFLASEQTGKLLLKDARQLIRNLKYGEALEKLIAIAGLKVLTDSVALSLLEVAYYYHETGKKKEARQIADRAGSLLSIQKAPETLDALIDEAAPGFLDTLKARYYPEMVPVPGGRLAERNVKIDSFFMAATETTIWQFSIFCKATGRDIKGYSYSPTLGVSGPNPAVDVDWYDALEYANWLSVRQNKGAVYSIDTVNEDTLNLSAFDNKKWTITANWEAGGFRLPTEAEWEYAAREGPEQAQYDYSGSNNIDEVAWYSDNSSIEGTNQTHPVKGKKANKLRLYDMSGNVWEWCWDWYAEYDPDIIDNPKGPDRGQRRVLRGGSWNDRASLAQVSDRSISDRPSFRSNRYGFRLARAR